jgi:hypothetical protein
MRTRMSGGVGAGRAILPATRLAPGVMRATISFPELRRKLETFGVFDLSIACNKLRGVGLGVDHYVKAILRATARAGSVER